MRQVKVSRLIMVLEQLVPRLASPKREYEQYRTPPEIAVDIALCIARHPCSLVIDLGSGTGMLSYAVHIVTGCYAVGVEIDEEAAQLARGSRLYTESIVDFIVADVAHLPIRQLGDVCIVQNPPFGVSRRRADRAFINAGIGVGAHTICSLHYAGQGVKRYLARILGQAGYCIDFIKVYKFPLPAMYSDHVKRIHYIPVLLLKAWRVERGQSHDAEECRGTSRA
ncbi:MAG TPA: hypothetical protein EYH50_02525 [Pyrodictium delaneyi]|uniref:Methyltransferase small domain-containing protein n=1 Tax=Pyrodictium delaneyi TaxID=1273541 RepID=A0A832ZU29_9CREN|nr:hypothetical protein [Pyrodictium delaneyi]